MKVNAEGFVTLFEEKNIYFQELDVDVKLEAYLAPFNTIEDFKVLYPAVNIFR